MCSLFFVIFAPLAFPFVIFLIMQFQCTTISVNLSSTLPSLITKTGSLYLCNINLVKCDQLVLSLQYRNLVYVQLQWALHSSEKLGRVIIAFEQSELNSSIQNNKNYRGRALCDKLQNANCDRNSLSVEIFDCIFAAYLDLHSKSCQLQIFTNGRSNLSPSISMEKNHKITSKTCPPFKNLKFYHMEHKNLI